MLLPWDFRRWVQVWRRKTQKQILPSRVWQELSLAQTFPWRSLGPTMSLTIFMLPIPKWSSRWSSTLTFHQISAELRSAEIWARCAACLHDDWRLFADPSNGESQSINITTIITIWYKTYRLLVAFCVFSPMIIWKFTKFQSAQVKFNTNLDWPWVHESILLCWARLRLVVAEVQLRGSASATFEQDPKSSKDLKSKHQMISNSKDNLRITWGGGQALLFCGWMSKWLEQGSKSWNTGEITTFSVVSFRETVEKWWIRQGQDTYTVEIRWIYCASLVRSCASQKEYHNMTQSIRCLRSRQAWVQQAAWSLYIHDTGRLPDCLIYSSG